MKIKLTWDRREGGKRTQIMAEMADNGALTILSEVEVGPAVDANVYMHFDCIPECAATEAQRAKLAGWWLNWRDAPAYIGATVCKWAFAGMSPDQISAKYGDGRKVFRA